MTHPVPVDPPAHPEWRSSRPHPLQLPPEAVRSLRDLSVAAAQRQLAPAPARPVVHRRHPSPLPAVVVHRTEPERSRLWPWLGPIARVILVALACAGILALGYVSIVGFALWMGGR